MATISIECPNCRKSYAVDESVVGRQVACQSCQTSFTIERPQNAASSPTAGPPRIVVPRPSESDEFELAPLDEPKAAAAAAKPAQPVATATAAQVQMIQPGRQDLSELLDDKVLAERKKAAEEESHGHGPQKKKAKKKKKKRNSAPWMTEEAAGMIKMIAGGVFALLVVVGIIGVLSSGVIKFPSRPTGPPKFSLMSPRTVRQGGEIIITVGYENSGGYVTGNERLFWVLEGPESRLETDVTDEVSSSGTLKGHAPVAAAGPANLVLRIEIRAPGKAAEIVSNKVSVR